MPSRTRACHQAVRAIHRPSPSTALWITDDILASAFNRFVGTSHATKRFGSNVPGPLEAQRRLAKRRMMGMATVGGGTPPDLGALFGSGPPKVGELRWEAPVMGMPSIGHAPGWGLSAGSITAPDEKGVSEDWTLSREQYLDSRHGDDLNDGLNIFDNMSVKDQEILEHGRESFENRLNAARTIGHMRTLRSELRTEYMDQVDFSRKAFQSILECASGSQQLAFLEDPRLNIPESRNLTTLLATYTSQIVQGRSHHTSFTAHSFTNTLYKLISLGSVLPEELVHIIENAESFILAHRIHLEQNGIATIKLHDSPQKVIINLYKWIFRGMVACRVTPVDMHAVRLLYTRICTPEWSRPLNKSDDDEPQLKRSAVYEQKLALRLRFKLSQFIWPLKGHEGPEFPPLDKVLVSWVADVTNLEQLPAHAAQEPKLTLNREKLVAHIEAMGPHEEEAIYSATATLMSQKPPSQATSEEHQMWQSKLHVWLSCLRSSLRHKSQIIHEGRTNGSSQLTYRVQTTWRRIYEILAPNATLTNLSPLFSTLHPLDVSRVLLELYMHGNKDLTNSKRSPGERGVLVDLTRVMEIRSALERLNLRVYADAGPNRSTQLFSNIFTILTKEKLPYRFFMNDVFDFIRKTRVSTTPLLKLIHAFLRNGVETYPQPIQKIIEELVHQDPLAAYKLFRARPIWLSSIPELPITLAKRGVHSRIIFNMLKYKDPTRLPNLVRKEKQNPAAALRVKLIHLIADAMSRHPSSRSRVVFRDVHRCYKYLTDRGYAAEPLMSRALARAGVTLPLQRGEDIPSSRFVWILNVVRGVEGDKVARQLDTVAYRWRKRVRLERSTKRVELRRQGLPARHVDIKAGGSPSQHSKGYNVWDRPSMRRIVQSKRLVKDGCAPEDSGLNRPGKPGAGVFRLSLRSQALAGDKLLPHPVTGDGESSTFHLDLPDSLATAIPILGQGTLAQDPDSLRRGLDQTLSGRKGKRKSGRVRKASCSTMESAAHIDALSALEGALAKHGPVKKRKGKSKRD